ncbi:DUF418 domain-containing protein [Sphingomonas xinjiangensis]|uniref:DUF418 domain-containing protein n=1 Tax=Sphingomonas xinjiangensis TaxID=643568 RepID=A0A840Y8F2_9SPHN|nr:DUF418 domain-containing protein [Sphingomonas xinjiangensis]MBB5709597.1 uncharacterized protein [Sphingomonas xinjiangensis]
MAPPSNSVVKPQRLESLDRIRGVAVLGILLLNIVGFALPGAAYENPRAYGGWHGADLLAWGVNFLLFDGKMRGLFSFLFGASILLIADAAQAGGRDPVRVHYTRMAWLLVFGVAHLCLLWDGDILAHYALVGALAFPLRRLPTERLVILGLLLVVAAMAVFALVPLLVWTLQHQASDVAGAQANAGQLQSLNNSFGIPSAQAIARELAQYRGGYLPILRARIAESGTNPLAMLFFYGPETLAYMLLGMASLRSGLLGGAWPRERYRRWLRCCWGFALPAYAALAAWLVASGFALLPVTLASLPLTALVRPLMIVGWICLLHLALHPGSALASRLAAAGQMAFTNYLMTSLLCTSIFYGYGLGWFGHFSRWQLYPIVVAVWLLILLWSKPWLARFRFGPLEWLWRSLARGAVQPMRRTDFARSAIASQ